MSDALGEDIGSAKFLVALSGLLPPWCRSDTD
jgi:hypothetical protein